MTAWCILLIVVFFFNDTATTEIYTLSLHDALPILLCVCCVCVWCVCMYVCVYVCRSEEHTSELQSLTNLVCRLLLEKKKNTFIMTDATCPRTPLRAHEKEVLGYVIDVPLNDCKRRCVVIFFFFFNDRAPPEIYPFSLHDALPI